MWIRSQDKKVIFDMTAECSIGIEKDGTIRGGKKDTILGKYPVITVTKHRAASVLRRWRS